MWFPFWTTSQHSRKVTSFGAAKPAIAALACVCLAATGFSLKWLPDVVAGYIALAASVLMLGTIAASRLPVALPPSLPAALIFLAVLLYIPVIVLQKMFSDLNLGDVLFHLENGIAGTPLSDYSGQIFGAVLSLVGVMVALVTLSTAMALRQEIYLAIAVLIFVLNPFMAQSFSEALKFVTPSPLWQKLADPEFLDVNPPLPDIVIIYVEGTDQRFSDRTVFGDVYDPVAGLDAESLVLKSVGQIRGTGFSVAGMMASQCGVPSVEDRSLRVFAKIECLGEVLSKFGYLNYFFVGGDKEFGGIRKFYEENGGFRVSGYSEITAEMNPTQIESAAVYKIADDELLFSAALQRHAQLLMQSDPFALVVETSGPHGIPSFLARRCSGSGKAEKTDDVGLAVQCTTELALEFIHTIRQSQAAFRSDRPLRIVLLSDHLNHASDELAVSTEFEGFNTVLLLGDPAYAGRVIDRVGSMVDVYPTILDWLGFARKPVAAGIGRSLLSEPPTLAENIGLTRETLSTMKEEDVFLQMLSAPYPVAAEPPSQ
jgi:phosphoglycerol transferase